MKGILEKLHQCRFCALISFIADIVLYCFYFFCGIEDLLVALCLLLVLCVRYALGGILSYIYIKQIVFPAIISFATGFMVLFALNLTEGDVGAIANILPLLAIGVVIGVCPALIAALIRFCIKKVKRKN